MIDLRDWPDMIKRLILTDPILPREGHPFGETRGRKRQPTMFWLLHNIAERYDPDHQDHGGRYIRANTALHCIRLDLDADFISEHWFDDGDYPDQVVETTCFNLIGLYRDKRAEERKVVKAIA